VITRKSANPGDQDQEQKQPIRARRAILTGGAVSLAAAAAAAGTTLGQTQPASAATTLPGVATISPSGDTTGAADITAFNGALTTLGNVGTVWLTPGTYYIKGTGISIPPYVNVYSPGNNQTVINCVGGGTGTYVLMANTNNPTGYTRLSGSLQGFVIDGTGAGTDAIGLQFQDTNGVYIDVGVRNFTSGVGVQLTNNLYSLNQMDGYGRIENCAQGLVFTTTVGAEGAMEHIYVNWSINCSAAGQAAITLAGSVGIYGSKFTCAVGCYSSGGPVFTFGSGCIFGDSIFEFRAEQVTGGTCTTASFDGNQSGWTRCTGVMYFASALGASNIATAGGKAQFDGPMTGDATLLNLPSGTTSGDTYTNEGCPCIVAISGGTVSAIVINGVTLTGLTSGAFYIPPAGTYSFTYTGSPTITFTSAAAA
jgi:hypothetical protein